MSKKLRNDETVSYRIRKGDRVAIPYDHEIQGDCVRRARSGEVEIRWDRTAIRGTTQPWWASMHNPRYLDKKRYSEWVPGR